MIPDLDQQAWNDKRKCIPVNHKNVGLVLQAFKRILSNMEHKESVLNNYTEFHNQAQFKIAQLYPDEVGAFKREF